MKGTPIIPKLLNRWVELFVGDTKEAFKYELPIRLFQFHTWILLKTDSAVEHAGLLAATGFMRHIEEGVVISRLPEREAVLANVGNLPPQTWHEIQAEPGFHEYRDIFDNVIAEYGGISEFAYTPSAQTFDQQVEKRLDSSKISEQASGLSG